MNKINVLQVCNQLGIGGTERVLEMFTENLNKDLFNVAVCGVYDGGAREESLRLKGFETHIINGNQEKFQKLLLEKKIDIIHIHRSGRDEGFVIQTAKRAGVPLVVETNVFGLNDFSQNEKFIDSHLLVSKSTYLKYIKKARIPPEKFLLKSHVLYNPIDLEVFEKYKPSQMQIKRFKSNLGLDESPLICRVGRPDPIKWSNFSIKMMVYLVKYIPEVKFLVVGGIPKFINSQINRYKLENNFIDIGPVSESDLILIYNSIDILAHCSRIGESFGYTIAEAMSAGKPVVVNSTPWADNAQVELVDNGVTGYVANTPKNYALAIADLINNREKAKRMGSKGNEKARRLFDVNHIMPMVEKIYVSLMSDKKLFTNEQITKAYESIEFSPSSDDILKYPNEYLMRLNSSFGKTRLLEKLKAKLKLYD